MKQRALAFIVFAALLVGSVGAESQSVPGSLLVFYSGTLKSINGLDDVDLAAAEFGRYDHVFFGDGAVDAGSGSYDDNAAIIGLLDETQVWGYINLGVTNGNLSRAEIESLVDAWKAAGADGIFYDAAGTDWGVSAERLGDAVQYVRSQGMPVTINTWFPEDADGFLQDGDFYFSESFVVKVGEIDPLWRDKADQVADLGYDVLAVTTNDASNDFDQDEWFTAFEAAAEYGYEAIGWGEYLFSVDGFAPWRERPAAPAGEPETVTLDAISWGQVSQYSFGDVVNQGRGNLGVRNSVYYHQWAVFDLSGLEPDTARLLLTRQYGSQSGAIGVATSAAAGGAPETGAEWQAAHGAPSVAYTLPVTGWTTMETPSFAVPDADTVLVLTDHQSGFGYMTLGAPRLVVTTTSPTTTTTTTSTTTTSTTTTTTTTVPPTTTTTTSTTTTTTTVPEATVLYLPVTVTITDSEFVITDANGTTVSGPVIIQQAP